MKRIARSSLGRILIGFVLVAAVFAGAWLWSLSGPLTNAVIRQQQDSLIAVAQSATLLLAESSTAPTRIADQLVARTDMRLTIVAADGTVLVDSDADPARMENHGDRPEIAAALRGDVGLDQRASQTEGTEQLYAAVPGTLDGARVAVRIAQPLDEVNRLAASSRRLGLLLLGFAAAVAVAIAVSTARSAARPVQELSEAAERMAGGNLSVRIPDVPTDLDVLASSLDTMRTQMRSRIEALEAERLTLRSTLDGLTDAVIVLEGETIALANTSASAMFGTPPGGWAGAVLDRSGLPQGVLGAIVANTGAPEQHSVDVESDPTGRAFRVTIAPFEPDGVGRRTIAVVSDITERARLDRVRRDFVANASHELKTPVAGIGLLAQSAEYAAADGDDDQAVAFARQIGAETARLRRLVGDLLDLSRLEAVGADQSLTDVRKAVDLALTSHGPAAGRKGLALDSDLTAVAGEEVFVSVDPTDMAIALDNLIDNAIAYTDSGSVRVRITTTDSVVTIAVEDSGTGIDPEHLPRIFERFYRVDRSRSRDAGGTGLGLSLVKHVAERNGGSVSVQSHPDEGSTFTLSMRRAR